MITVLVTDRNLQVVGDPIQSWTTLDVVSRFNEPGSGFLTAPATPGVMAQIEAGNRIAILRDGAVYSAGPYEQSEYMWAVSGEAAEPGQVIVHWAEDLALIAGRIAYPTPGVAADGLQGDYWSVTATNAELAMREAVNLNAGPGALAARQVPQLVLGAVAGVGAAVTYKTRWAPLGEVLRDLALAGGELGFRTSQVGADIEFQVYDPQDLTGSVRFSRGLGNLREAQYTRTGPTATAAIVGAQGDLEERTIVERVNTTTEAAWWRVEQFVDQRQTDDGNELQQAGDAALEEGDETARLSTVTVDTRDQKFGQHYGLGDRVTVVPRPGVEVADIVRSAHLQASPRAGELVTVLVGSQAASSDPLWLRRMRALQRRLAHMEANVTTAQTTAP